MSEKETLDGMKILFGENVVCTNGLYHIYCEDHSEVYVNTVKKELDKRCKYITIVVTDSIIVAQVLGIQGISYVILWKDTLECMYKTKGRIHYIDKNILCDIYNNKTTVISHIGKTLTVLNDIQSIEVLDNNKYLVKSKNSFSDTILVYKPQLDLILSIAKNKRYLIYKSKDCKDAVEVISMQGGKYIYKFKSNECINSFTDKVESIQLFDMMG